MTAAAARLSPRVLNRALLSRQYLLRRHDLPERDVVEHLVGMHSQIRWGRTSRCGRGSATTGPNHCPQWSANASWCAPR
ncbi:hypothetical protein C8D87_101359 [Lentzea atacamensis]|uniref:Uncharacterized protein n=1 Tax=Lentzea atacamensis TaxID=531938 RepID=A0ABX9EIT0_9PSEU|nr:hypothetical protein C8D87_101359 [Lentzea atacamensis]